MSDNITTVLAFADEALLQELLLPFDVLSNSKLKTHLKNVQLISADELSDRIRSDSLVGVKACFYLTERWGDSPDDSAADQLLNELHEKAIASAILFCCEKTDDSVFDCPKKHSLVRLKVEPRNKKGDIVKPAQVLRFEKTYALLATLATLAACDPGAYYNNAFTINGNVDVFGAEIEILPNYDAVYVAVKHRLLENKDRLQEMNAKIENIKQKLQDIKDEPLKICEQIYPVVPMPDVQSPPDEKSLDKLCQSICDGFETYDDALSRAVHTHVSVTHASMAKIDASSDGNDAGFAEFFSKKDAKPASSAPGEADLLKNANRLKTERSFLRTATRAARELGEPGKPSFKSILTAFALTLGAFILIAGSVYLQQAITAGWQNVDKKLFALLLGVPAALLLLAALAALIVGLIQRAKVKSILKGLKRKIKTFFESASDYIRNLKAYLDDFVSVFFNYHFRERRIAVLERKERRLLKERDRMMQGIETINRFLELSFASAEIAGEKRADQSDLTFNVNSTDDCIYWINSCDSPDDHNSEFSNKIWETKNVWIKLIFARVMKSGGNV